MQLLAEGSTLNDLQEADSLFVVGDRGEVRLYLNREPTASELQLLEDRLVDQGMVLPEPVAYDARVILIRFTQGAAPWGIVGTVASGLFGGAIIGWQVFGEQKGIPGWCWLAIGVVGGVILLKK